MNGPIENGIQNRNKQLGIQINSNQRMAKLIVSGRNSNEDTGIRMQGGIKNRTYTLPLQEPAIPGPQSWPIADTDCSQDCWLLQK